MAGAIIDRCRAPQFRPLIMAVVSGVLACSCVAPTRPLAGSYREPWIQYFVARSPGDELALEDAIAAQIAARGLPVHSGELAAMPPTTDILVIYELRWFQNIFLRGDILRIEFRDARTGKPLAVASRRGVTPIGGHPQRLVVDAVNAVFAAPRLEESGAAPRK